MGVEVYADLYFLINASMDLLCLMLTSALMHRRTARWRAILGAIFGGGYALFALLYSVDGILGSALDLSAGLLICFIVYFGHKIRTLSFFQIAGVYMIVSATMGGIMTAMYYWLNQLKLPMESLQGESLSAWMFAVLAAVAGFLTLHCGKWFGISGKTKRVELKVWAFNKEVMLRGLIDSGNLLRDPISGRNVVVADRKALKGFFPDPVLRDAGDPTLQHWLSDYKNAKSVRLIPTKTATSGGMLIAVIPEKMEIHTNKESFLGDYLIAAGDVGSPGQDWNALVPLE